MQKSTTEAQRSQRLHRGFEITTLPQVVLTSFPNCRRRKKASQSSDS